MIFTVAQYIETLSSPDGRFRTLERLYPMVDETIAPVFAMSGHGLVDFEVMADGRRLTLRAPLRWDGNAAGRLRALVRKERGFGGRFFTEWRLLDREIVLFDDAGRTFEVDVLVRATPEGEPLVDFLGKAVVRRDTATVDIVRSSFEELAGWAGRVGCGGIAAGRLLVAPDGNVRLTGFSARDETERIRERLSTAANCQNPDDVEPGRSEYDFDGEGNVRFVKDAGGWMYVDSLGRAVTDTVWTKAEPFRGGRAEVETLEGRGLVDHCGREVISAVYEEVVWDDYWGLAAVMTDGRWSLADSEGAILTTGFYDWLGECSEGFVLAVREGKCGFLDIVGREAIAFIYDDASSFSEGLALVSCGGEEFFIDPRGERI